MFENILPAIIGAFIGLVGNRHNVNSSEFSTALNSVSVVFYDSKEVLNSTKKFFLYLESGKTNETMSNERLIEIFSIMMRELGIDENKDEAFLHKVFR